MYRLERDIGDFLNNREAHSKRWGGSSAEYVDDHYNFTMYWKMLVTAKGGATCSKRYGVVG